MKNRLEIVFLPIICFNQIPIYPVVPDTVCATITVGVTPAGIAITPDSAFAYVANNNNYGLTGLDSVSVVNLKNNMLKTTIFDASFNEPYTVTINQAGTKAYVTNSNTGTITIINIPQNTVAGTINGFDGPSGMAIVPGTQKAYVNNYGAPGGAGSGNATGVRVVNLLTDTIVGSTIEVNQAPASLAASPDGAYIYVINYTTGETNSGTLQVIRTSDNTVIQTIGCFSGPFALVVTPDGKYAYVSNFGSNNFWPIGTTVSVVDLKTYTIVKTIDLGIQVSGLAITPDGRFVYASNYNTLYAGEDYSNLTAGQGTVQVIDTATNTVVSVTIPVGQSPDAIAIAKTGEYAYVTNYTSNTVSVIALQSFWIVAQGYQIQNYYLTQKDLINKITWSVSGTSLPIEYSIYRDAELTDLAGTVLATEPSVFLDHGRKKHHIYTYYIVGTNKVGTGSNPVLVTIGKE